MSGIQTYLIVGLVVIMLGLGGYAYVEHLNNNALQASVSTLTVANAAQAKTITQLQADALATQQATQAAQTAISTATASDAAQAQLIRSKPPAINAVDPTVGGLFNDIAGASK